ncbi:MAG TPA: hypothetical protein H9973_03600 [Candidatus Alistipes cottocaccae]|nr:hypothetical protein [Candidatus Alistipes cottocaccae]
MKKFIFYAVALLSVASLLNGCKKDDGNESKGPNVEGVFWFDEEETAPGVMEGLYLKDGYMSYCGYAKSDEGAAMLSVGTSKTVKKGNIVLTFPLGAYTIVKNEDGTSGTINSPYGKIEYSGLTENSVFFVEGNETVRMQLYTLEYLGFPVTGIVE